MARFNGVFWNYLKRGRPVKRSGIFITRKEFWSEYEFTNI